MASMAQIPQQFQLPGPAPIQAQPGFFQGAAGAVPQGLALAQHQMALQQEQQKIQLAKQQQLIQQTDVLLKNGLEYPTLMKAFWKPIATTMNQISPDYGLDPNNPPEDLGGAFKFLSGTSDALQAGVINPQQAHAVIKGELPNFKPKAVPPGTVGENEMPGQAGYQQKLDQLLSMGPTMAKEGLPLLEATPEAQQFKSALEQQRQLAVSTQAQHQDAIRSLASSFESQSQDAKNVFDNLNVFNSQMQLSRQFAGAKDTTGAVNAEKASLLAFAQMAYPGTGRPGNMEMLENMEKSGPYGTLISQALNRIDKGEIMTDSQIKGLRQAAVAIAQARESSQTDQENTTANAIRLHGGDPSAFLRNYRPSTIHSTSPLFPSTGGGHPRIGQVVKGFKFLGGDPSEKEHWAPAGQNE